MEQSWEHPPPRPSQRLCFSLSHSLRNAPSPPPAAAALSSSCGPLSLRLPLPLFHCTCKLTLRRCPLPSLEQRLSTPAAPPASFCAALGVHPLSVPLQTLPSPLWTRLWPPGLTKDQLDFGKAGPCSGSLNPGTGSRVACPWGAQAHSLKLCAESRAPGYQHWASGICAAAAPGEGICLSWSQRVVA